MIDINSIVKTSMRFDKISNIIFLNELKLFDI